MKIIRLGHHIVCVLILIIILLFQIISFTHAQEGCDESFPELSEANLFRIFSMSLVAGRNHQIALEEVWNFVTSRYPKGKKLTQLQGQECREVSGIHIDLDYHINGKDFPPVIKEEGSMDADVHHVVQISYDRQGVIQGRETQEIYNITLVLALKSVLPDQIVLKAEKLNLCPDETSSITAELKCGKCSMKMKEISFQWKGPGEVSPVNTSTGRDGIAKTVFKAQEEGETEITAYYHDKFFGIKTAKINIKTESCVTWDVIVTFSYTSRDVPYFTSYSLRGEFKDAHAIWRRIPPSPLVGETIELFGLNGKGQCFLLHWESRWCCDDEGKWVSENPPELSSSDAAISVTTYLDTPKIVRARAWQLSGIFSIPDYTDYTEIPLEKFKKAREDGIPFTFDSSYEGKDSAGTDIKETVSYTFIPKKKKG